jgi:hypothetical protein
VEVEGTAEYARVRDVKSLRMTSTVSGAVVVGFVVDRLSAGFGGSLRLPAGRTLLPFLPPYNSNLMLCHRMMLSTGQLHIRARHARAAEGR